MAESSMVVYPFIHANPRFRILRNESVRCRANHTVRVRSRAYKPQPANDGSESSANQIGEKTQNQNTDFTIRSNLFIDVLGGSYGLAAYGTFFGHHPPRLPFGTASTVSSQLGAGVGVHVQYHAYLIAA